MSSNILYLSTHSILEYDEVRLFHELGYKVFSPGAYIDPKQDVSSMRTNISGLVYDQNILDQWYRLCSKFPGEDGKDHLTKEFVDNFDTVVVMHLPRWIEKNWEAMKHKRVIWRTIGQSIGPVEQKLLPYRQQGMQIVRYSPRETTIPGFIGQDALIRFYKDPEEYKGWNGKVNRVITFGQSMKQRDQACNFTLFEEVTRPFNRHLFGPGNDQHGLSWATGKVPPERLIKEMQDNRCYFYTGTHPASYTLNFMEAFMTGIPIVAIGPKHGNADYFPGHNLYEIPDFIQNGVNGFISDKPNELQMYINIIMSDIQAARALGEEGRKTAIHHFGKDLIAGAWKAFLG